MEEANQGHASRKPGRLTGKTYSDSTPSVTYAYDQTSFNGLAITNGNGQRTGMTDGSGSTAWSYDQMGRCLVRQQTNAAVTRSIAHTYNPDGSVATITYPSGRVYTYTYNNAGQVASVADTAHGINFFSSPQYAPPGLPTSSVYGAVPGWNAITNTNTFNNRLQPTQLQAASPVPLTLLSLSYSYDQGSGHNNGDVVQIINGRDSTRTAAYTYDQVNRLATAQTPNANNWGDAYVYDAWGNLLQKNVIKGTAENMLLTVNNKNQVTTPGFTYDAAGNVIWDTTNALTYDAEGRMNPLSGVTNTYDGDGRRVQKSDGTLYWVDDNFQPLSVGTTTGITRDYIFVAGQRIAFVPLSTGNPYYYLSDHLGSDTVVTSGDGKSIQWEGEFFPFGLQRTVITNLADNPYQFTGYEYDSGTGYNYAVARFDAGRWGRFLSPDPYLGSIKVDKPQSLNRYTYALNNPLEFIDPLGLENCVDSEGHKLPEIPDSDACVKAGGTWDTSEPNGTVNVSANWSDLPFTGWGLSGAAGDTGSSGSWLWVATKSFFIDFSVFGSKNDPRPSCFGSFLKDSGANFVGIPGVDTVAATATVHYGISQFRAQPIPNTRVARGGISPKQWLAADDAARVSNAGKFSLLSNADVAMAQAFFQGELPAALAGECK